MKRTMILSMMALTIAVAASTVAVRGQETFTGTILEYGSGRYLGMRTANFTLDLTSMTSPAQAQSFLAELQSGGQDALREAVRKEEIGRFSLNTSLARAVNVAVERSVNGKRKIRIIFERWEHFAELRGGYRSLDFPFTYIELDIDPRTGKGTGKYFAAAKIRWKKSRPAEVEIEDYATTPAKLLNVETRGIMR